MKFVVHRDNLRKAISMVGHAIPSKTSLPVLANILVQSDGDTRLRVAATNLELGITCWIPATITERGQITVPGKLGGDLVNNLPSEPIHVNVDATSIRMQCGKFDNTIMGLSAEDFPTLPKITHPSITLPRAFVDAIDHVIVAAATDDSRPVLTAVRIVVNEHSVELVCADGFRLARTTFTLSEPAAPTEILVPARTMAEVLRIMGNAESITMAISPNNNQVAFISEDVEIVSRVIEGKYPDVARVIPTEFQSQFVFEIDELRRASKVAALMNPASGVKLMITPMHIALISSGQSIGTGQALIGGVHEGAPHDINLNVKYLQDALNAVQSAGGTQAVLRTTSSTAPAILQAVGNTNYVHVVMPMMVR